MFLYLMLSCLISGAQVLKVETIGFTVKDMKRSKQFYESVLGFSTISDTIVYGDEHEKIKGLFGIKMRIVVMKLGTESIELTDFLTTGGRSIPEDAKSNDLIFQHIAIVVSDMEKAYRKLLEMDVVHVSTGPQTLPLSNPAAAGIKAFYFQDPDGHNLELIYFPRGKGLAKWQETNGKLFLGIDHTAIGIADTDKSLRFYRDLLGLERKGESWNMGTEQAHLNFVENASLHITGLRTGEGPGIEFLQYLSPGPGKTYPTDTRADDLWYWQTTLVVENAGSVYEKLKNAGYTLLSQSPVLVKGNPPIGFKSFIVRDGDGHAILIKENVRL